MVRLRGLRLFRHPNRTAILPQLRALNRRSHLRNSARTRVISIGSVAAVTIPRVSGNVLIAQSTSHAMRAVLPTPWPLATAISIARPKGKPSRMSARISACQGSGPVEFDSSPSPHANACCTNKSGSLATSDDNHAAMSSSSSACSGSSAVTVIFNPTSLIQQIPFAQRPKIAKSSAAPFRAVLLALAFRHQFLDLGFGHHFECLGRDEVIVLVGNNLVIGVRRTYFIDAHCAIANCEGPFS